jgi:hypothetical protein
MLVAAATAGCGEKDCTDACQAMRDCGLLYGTANSTCEVRCKGDEEAKASAIDECATCVEGSCDRTCFNDCVCALGLELAEYPATVCVQ